jgi:hypothetical protein
MGIGGCWSKDPPGFRFERPGLYCEHPRPSVALFEPLQSFRILGSGFRTYRSLKTRAISLAQVMNKELVDPLAHSRWQYDPADADYAWVAKVMLLASPAREELIAKTCHLAGTEAANSLN